MINLEYVQSIKQGDLEASVALLNENWDFVFYMSKCFGVDVQYYGDFRQLAWLAIVETAENYDFSFAHKNTFKVLWKRYTMKHYLDFRLEQFYTMKVARSTYTKIKSTIGIENSILAPVGIQEDFGLVNNNLFFNIEKGIMSGTLWDEVYAVLDGEELKIVIDFYKKEKTLKVIAKELSLSVDEVKYRKKKALKQLRSNKYIQAIGHDYFYLNV